MSLTLALISALCYWLSNFFQHVLKPRQTGVETIVSFDPLKLNGPDWLTFLVLILSHATWNAINWALHTSFDTISNQLAIKRVWCSRTTKVTSKTGKFATWKIFERLTDDNWRQLTTTDGFYIISTMWLPKWRHKKAPCDDLTTLWRPEWRHLKTKWRHKWRHWRQNDNPSEGSWRHFNDPSWRHWRPSWRHWRPLLMIANDDSDDSDEQSDDKEEWRP